MSLAEGGKCVGHPCLVAPRPFVSACVSVQVNEAVANALNWSPRMKFVKPDDGQDNKAPMVSDPLHGFLCLGLVACYVQVFKAFNRFGISPKELPWPKSGCVWPQFVQAHPLYQRQVMYYEEQAEEMEQLKTKHAVLLETIRATHRHNLRRVKVFIDGQTAKIIK